MKNFKKGAFSKGGDFGGRPKFGSDRKFGSGDRSGDRQRGGDRSGFGGGRPELFSAICSNCGKPCELPFRPSGDRPVFCRDCFDKKDDTRGHSTFQRTERPREFRPVPREGGNGSDNTEIKKQLGNLEYKLDRILKLLSEGSAPKEKDDTSERRNEAPKTAKKTSAPEAKSFALKIKSEATPKKAVARKTKPVSTKKTAKKK